MYFLNLFGAGCGTRTHRAEAHQLLKLACTAQYHQSRNHLNNAGTRLFHSVFRYIRVKMRHLGRGLTASTPRRTTASRESYGKLEQRTGLEPVNTSFAVRAVTNSGNVAYFRGGEIRAGSRYLTRGSNSVNLAILHFVLRPYYLPSLCIATPSLLIVRRL